MNVVVTGATSFIGAVTVRRLLERGDRVYAVVRPGSSHLGDLESKVPEHAAGRLRMIALDLKEIGRIGESIRQNPFMPETAGSAGNGGESTSAGTAMIAGDTGMADVWIHIGWDGAGSQNRTKRDVQQENVKYALDAVRAAANLGCRRFLFTGSQAEYGVCHQLTAEDTPCCPVSEYGKAKVDFYNQAKNLCKILKMEYIHTRIFSVYGPGDHPWSLVQSCLRTWQQGETMSLGECTQQWNFLYIEDTAAALVCLLTEGHAGVYNIASEDTRTLREYIEEMYGLCGSRGNYLYGKRPPNAEGPADLMPDIRKICRETGWRPKTTFAEGINETLHSMRPEAAGNLPF